MATVKFLIKGNKNPQTTIYLRLRDGRQIDITISTGITISPKYWSTVKNWFVQKSEFHNKIIIEKNLRSLEEIIQGDRNERISNGLPINKEWLESLIQKWQGKTIGEENDFLIDLINHYIEKSTERVRDGKIGVSSGTLRNYKTTIGRLTKFEQSFKKKFRAIEIDFTFHENYLKFAKEKLHLAPNSIGKDIKNIKTVCREAKERNINVHNQVFSRRFSAPTEKTLFITLTDTEIDLIKQFKGSNYLENARDWLIIGCWTGCRVADLMKLNNSSIKLHKSGKNIIQYIQNKTGKLVNVPLHPDVNEIVYRLNGFPRPISNEKFNKYIKEVGRLSGLTNKEYGSRQNPITRLKEVGEFEKYELITSHICRRSFATIHYNELSNKQIMAVTGHSTEKMLLNYIGETEVEHIEDFIELWENPKMKNI